MSTSLSLIRSKVKVILQDDALLLGDPDELNALIATATEHYSKDKPRRMASTFPGDGGFNYALPSDWSDYFSFIVRVEYPSGEQTPCYIPNEEWTLYRTDPDTLVLRFLNAIPSATENIRIEYGILHTLNVTTSTIPDSDFEAISYLATSYCCIALAQKTAQTSEPTIAADAVDYMSKTEQYARRANELLKGYYRLIKRGEKGSVVAGMIVRDTDTNFIWGGDFITHPRRFR